MSATTLSQREPLFVGAAEAARLLGISRASLYARMNAGEIATVKFGGRRLVPLAALHNLAERAA